MVFMIRLSVAKAWLLYGEDVTGQLARILLTYLLTYLLIAYTGQHTPETRRSRFPLVSVADHTYTDIDAFPCSPDDHEAKESQSRC